MAPGKPPGKHAPKASFLFSHIADKIAFEWFLKQPLTPSLTSRPSCFLSTPLALETQNPLAWPAFATGANLRGLPRFFIRLNECDPLRDEVGKRGGLKKGRREGGKEVAHVSDMLILHTVLQGLLFYRKLVAAGVSARCVESKGTIHAAELFAEVVTN